MFIKTISENECRQGHGCRFSDERAQQGHQKQRQEKLERMKSIGLNQYPQPNLSQKYPISEAREMMDKSVEVAGRLMSLRGHGKILFADLHINL